MATAKISAYSASILDRLQSIEHKPKIILIEVALKKYEDQLWLDKINEGYDRLKADKKAWKEELTERLEIEGTIGDGLEDE